MNGIDINSMVVMMVFIITSSNFQGPIKWQTPVFIWLLESGLHWYLIANVTISHTLCVSQFTLLTKYLCLPELHKKLRAAPKLSNKKLTYQNHLKVCAHPHWIHCWCTSRSIPHTLNNSSWSTSLPHIKKQSLHMSLWMSRWKKTFLVKVNKLKLLSSAPYCTDTVWRRVRPHTFSFSLPLFLTAWLCSPLPWLLTHVKYGGQLDARGLSVLLKKEPAY